MTGMIFVNLPVTDLQAAIAFYIALDSSRTCGSATRMLDESVGALH